MNVYEKTPCRPGKNHMKELELIVLRAHTGPGILFIPTASLENLTIHSAFGRA